jgi:hypothetical protein
MLHLFLPSEKTNIRKYMRQFCELVAVRLQSPAFCKYRLFDPNNAPLEGQDAAQPGALAAVNSERIAAIEATWARKEPKISLREEQRCGSSRRL